MMHLAETRSHFGKVNISNRTKHITQVLQGRPATPHYHHQQRSSGTKSLFCRASSSETKPDGPWAPDEEPKKDPWATKEVYSDNDPISKFMIYYFSKVMSKQLGDLPFDGSYDGFVELSRGIMRGRNTKEQQETVAGVLSGLLPPQAPERFRKWFPLNRTNAEFNAWITTLGFGWLVGPSKVVETEVVFNGKTEIWNSGVKITKCRYLESSGCVGMCTNMCKIPTERFFTETFGLPLQMNPDFETLECNMLFGVPPVPIEQDPVYNQPCLAVCNLQTKSSKSLEKACPKVDTERKYTSA